MDFKLRDNFVEKYKNITPPFGFNGLGELTYMRTYSRLKLDGTNERWYETVRRVVEGTYSVQKRHIFKYDLGWNKVKAHRSAEEMYDRMFNMKFLPAGRGIWAMGSHSIEEKGLFPTLNSCAFVSTENLSIDKERPFSFMMDMEMLGVGVGFDVKGAEKLKIQKPIISELIWSIPDSREGWIEATKILLTGYFEGKEIPNFNYALIRKAGEPIHGFGGKSAGPEPLRKLHAHFRNLLDKRIGECLTETDIVDMMNMIGVCVVSANVRSSAQIVFGSPESEEFLKLKDYEWNDEKQTYIGSNVHRAQWGWTSNNSILADIGMDYSQVAKQTGRNGEPGYAWLENMQQYGRMGDQRDANDIRAVGANPCFSYDTSILIHDYHHGIDKNVLIGSLVGKDVTFINKNGKKVKGSVWKSGRKKTIRLIWNEKGKGHSIKCTPDHTFMSISGVPIRADESKYFRLMPFYEMKNTEDMNMEWVSLGFVQGDGRTNPAPRQKIVTAIFGKKDYDIEQVFVPLEYSKLDELGFSKNKLPERDLPSEIDLWSSKSISDFLTGLYSANGSALERAGRVTLKTTNYRLAEKVQELLKRYLIDSYITINKSKLVKFPNGEYICKESYDLNVANFRSIVNFTKHINFIQKYKRNILKEIILNKSPKIQHIVEGEEEDVYDFSLQDNTHWGVVEGFIAHNCMEQTLESYEMCCLVDVFPIKHKDLQDFKRTLKFAYLYAKTVTLGKTHWIETNRVQLRNRRIGTSLSGITQFINTQGIEQFRKWCNEGYSTLKYYDNVYSEWFAVPKSIKITSVKPSGTVSLLAGVTPGMHYPESNYYIRRIRLSKTSDLISEVEKAGYKIEESKHDPENTLIVEIPVAIEGIKTTNEVSMWEQLMLASFLQEHWADNQVSCTVTFKPEEANQIEPALNYFQYKLKGISFLPKTETGKYAQMPYEEITKDEYDKLSKNIKKLKFKNTSEESESERFCDGQNCIL